MSRDNWTSEEDEYLRKTYGKKSIAVIRRTIGRSHSSIWTRAGALGLRKMSEKEINRRSEPYPGIPCGSIGCDGHTYSRDPLCKDCRKKRDNKPPKPTPNPPKPFPVAFPATIQEAQAEMERLMSLRPEPTHPDRQTWAEAKEELKSHIEMLREMPSWRPVA